MHQEFDGTGVITDITSSDTSVVSITINTVLKKFRFNKSIFYVFGVKCDGSLDNILENGMNVNLCYKLCENNKAYISAVWLGNKPENLQVDKNAPKVVYNQTGCVKQVCGDIVFVQSNNSNCVVAINKLGLFRDGYLFDEKNGLPVVGESVRFDAIPFDDGHESSEDPSASYQATCAWIGAKEPRLTDRFNLRVREDEQFQDEESYDEYTDGTVVVIPNDVVALIDVESEVVNGKVILFRSNFSRHCKRIQDMVAVGDTLRLRLRLGYIFPERKQWFVSRAWRHCLELTTEEKEASSGLSANMHLGLSDSTEETDVEDKEVTTQTVSVNDVADKRNSTGLSESSIPENEKRDIVLPTTSRMDNIMESAAGIKFPTFNSLRRVLFSNHQDTPLEGVIKRIPSHSAAYISYENVHIYVDKNNVFVEGSLCTPNQFDDLVKSGKNIVRFEAVKTQKHISITLRDAVLTHEAVCVWVGQKPSVLEVSSSLPPPDLALLKSNATFTGVVSKFYLPEFALVYVEKENTTVCLLSKIFQKTPNRCIAHRVKLGQLVKFKIMKLESCPITLCAYDVNVIWTSQLTSDTAKSKEKSTEGEIKETLIPFTNVHSPSQERTLLLNCKGTLKYVGSKSAVKVQHSFGFSKIINSPVIYGTNNDMPLNSEMLQSFNGRGVRFDAEVLETPSKDEYFCVKRMWEADVSRPSSERCLTTELCYRESAQFRAICTGKIKSIPFHDSAIAMVDTVPVLVPLESLVMEEKVNGNYVCIDEYLKEGDLVSLKIRQKVLPGENNFKYYKAIKCGRVKQVSDKCQETDMTDENSALSWMSVWGRGKYFCKGLVKRIGNKYGNKYFVSFKYSGGTDLSLNIFSKGKFVRDGVSCNQDNVGDIEGREITYHVAYSHELEVEEPSTHGMYVACAWTGDDPSNLVFMRDKLGPCLFGGSVNPNWMYEAIVNDFPLPTHMLCKIGPIPVVVPLTKTKKGENVVSVEKSDFIKGDIVRVCVQEVLFKGETFLVANEILKQTELCDVLAFFKGRLLRWSSPVGLIKLTNPDVTVVFELCHIITSLFAESGRDYEITKNAYLQKFVQLVIESRDIYVTAMKINGKTAPYRALRLWFGRNIF